MAFAGYITHGEQHGRSCVVTDHETVSVCNCGWTGTYSEAHEHLYGDLAGAARRFVDEQFARQRRA